MSFFTRKWQFLPCLYHLSSAPFFKRYMHWAMVWTLSIRRFLLATLKSRTYMSLSMPYSRAFMHRYRLYVVLTHRSVQIPARSEVSCETNHWTSDSHHHCEHGCSANISVILSQIIWIILTGIRFGAWRQNELDVRCLVGSTMIFRCRTENRSECQLDITAFLKVKSKERIKQ